jgi:DNA-directed RNA polymerase subunit K/omega
MPPKNKTISYPKTKLKKLENHISKDELDYGVDDAEIDGKGEDDDEELNSDEELLSEESSEDEDKDEEKSNKGDKDDKNKDKPSKEKKSKKVTKNINTDELPPLVVSSTKERYVYKPIISTTITIIHDTNRITSDCMTKFEYTEVVSVRAANIQMGGVCFTDVSNIDDPILKAKKEIYDKKCPLSILRMIKENVYEKYDVNSLAIPIDV